MDRTDSRPSRNQDEPLDKIDQDRLDFLGHYALPLARQIVDVRQMETMTLGVYGSWGSGKTSLMNMIRNLVGKKESHPSFESELSCLTVNFTAWKYHEAPSLWRAMVRTILDQLLDEDSYKTSKSKDAQTRIKEIKIIREALYGEVVEKKRSARLNWPRMIGALISSGAVFAAAYMSKDGAPISPLIQVGLFGTMAAGGWTAYIGQIPTGKKDSKPPDPWKALGQLSSEMAKAFDVVDEVLATHPRIEYIEQFSQQFQNIVAHYLDGRKLVVFIDDLDRCLPEKMVHVLEGIKLFTGVPNTVFVLGVDVPVLTKGIEIYYAGQGMAVGKGSGPFINGKRYLEKIVQQSFTIPNIGTYEMMRMPLVEDLCPDPKDRSWLRLGIIGFRGNPRATKRFVRLFRLRAEMIRSREPKLLDGRLRHLAKLVVIDEHPRWSHLINLILRFNASSEDLVRLGPLARLERAAHDAEEYEKLVAPNQKGDHDPLAEFARDAELMEFLRLEPKFEDAEPVNPSPLLNLGGGRTSEPMRLEPMITAEEAVEKLISDDHEWVNVLAGIRDMPGQSRDQIVEALVARLNGWASAKQPDYRGMARAAQSLSRLYEQGIGREFMLEKAEFITGLVRMIGADVHLDEEASSKLLKLSGVLNANRAHERDSSQTVMRNRQKPETMSSPAPKPERALGYSVFGDDDPAEEHESAGSDRSEERDIEEPAKAKRKKRKRSVDKVKSKSTKPKTEIANQLLEIEPDENQVDLLGFEVQVRGLAATIDRVKLPFFVGVLGPWGSGKTSVLYLIKRELEQLATPFLCAMADAKKTDPAILLFEALGSIQPKEANALKKAATSSKTSSEPDWTVFDRVLTAVTAQKRVAFLLDDLDRRDPSFVASLMILLQERLKRDGVFIAVAGNREWLVSSLASFQGIKTKSHDPLHKFLDFEFKVPGVNRKDLAQYVQNLVAGQSISEAVREVITFLKTNPRSVKRFVNQMIFAENLARQGDLSLGLRSIATALVLKTNWPELLKEPELLLSFGRAIKDGDLALQSTIIEEMKSKDLAIDPEQLHGLLETRSLPDPKEFEQTLRLIESVS